MTLSSSTEYKSKRITLEALYQLVQDQGEMIKQLQQELSSTKTELADARSDVKETEEQLLATVEYVESSTGGGSSGGSWWDRTTVGGYAEVHYNDVDADDSSRDFKETDIHRYVLFMNHEFNDRMRFFSELEVEHGLVQDTADGSNGGEVEIEQAYVEFDLNANHKAKAGLFLIPVGILNETHEPPTFYGVERNDVENILIPSTWWENGVAVSGQYSNGVSWDLAVHSGLEVPVSGSSAGRIRSGRQKSSNASAEDLAYTARLSYSGLPGLQLSASYQHQNDISQMGGDGLDEASLITAHAIYNRGGFQLRALYADWDIDGALASALDADSQTGWYVEPSYRFNTPDFDLLQSVGFYTRYEEIEGTRVQDQFDQWEIGVNLWPTDNVVLKIDYRDRSHDLNSAAGRDFKAIDLGVGLQF
ncbi:MAG: porin [Pseudomonadales bacterium]